MGCICKNAYYTSAESEENSSSSNLLHIIQGENSETQLRSQSFSAPFVPPFIQNKRGLLYIVGEERSSQEESHASQKAGSIISSWHNSSIADSYKSLARSIQLQINQHENAKQPPLNELSEEQARQAQVQDYLSASQTKRRIQSMRLREQQLQEREVRQRHYSFLMSLEEQHNEALAELSMRWKQENRRVKEGNLAKLEDLQTRHQLEIDQTIEQLEQGIPVLPKDSPELLSLERSRELLARREEFEEAHRVKLKIKELRAEEAKKWKVVRARKIKNQITILKQKQDKEMLRLQQRIRHEEDELDKTRAKQTEVLIQKFQNAKKDFHEKQIRETSRFYQLTLYAHRKITTQVTSSTTSPPAHLLRASFTNSSLAPYTSPVLQNGTTIAITSSFAKTSKTPSLPSTTNLSKGVNGICKISGSQITPTSLATESPRVRETAIPGKLKFFIHTRGGPMARPRGS